MDMDTVWDAFSKSKEQRKKTKKAGQGEVTNPKREKRSRETSPTANTQDKESQNKTSPPTKKGAAVDYSLSSEEEEAGFPIPTIISNQGNKNQRERIPNPFRIHELREWEDHPLQATPPPLAPPPEAPPQPPPHTTPPPTPQKTPPAQTKNDLEGVREEVRKYYEKQEENQAEHHARCGCDKCFWREKNKLGALSEKKVADFVKEFTKRKLDQGKTGVSHKPMCMCVLCIKRKIEESEEQVMNQVMGSQGEQTPRDPRITKECKQSK